MFDRQSEVRSTALPLAGIRVLEIADGKTEMCGRFLADLGADVVLLEPPGGALSRHNPPLVDGVSLYFATHNANKRSVVLDLESAAGRGSFLGLIDGADIYIDSAERDLLDSLGLGAAQLRARNPALVVLSISDFGRTGPYRDFIATDCVHSAMAGVLCRSGMPGLPPLAPPGSLAVETAAIQAAWVALLGYWQRLKSGTGDHLDFSIHEAIAQVVDPGLGVTGSASAGKSALEAASRDRPPPFPLYPIFPCKDGHVRICVLSPRQWEAMSNWLGPDHEFTDPAYGKISRRVAFIGKINALTAALFGPVTCAELLAEGQRRGIPIATVNTPGQVLTDAHFAARGAFAPLEAAPGVQGRAPSGFLEVDGQRAGIRTPAPAAGEHTAEVLQGLAARAGGPAGGSAAAGVRRRPLEGLRVLDLGIIVAGAEAGRILADQGAEVIKVESRAYPDGGRQSTTGDSMTASFANGHRNKLALGINLRSEKGVALFKQLVAGSDIILSNFKPGTLESLRLDYEVLKHVNPRIIMMESSALGRTGPQSRSLGYGPLVRASTGLTSLWRYPDVPGSFSDGVTIYPDHAAARVAAVGVMALLIRRERTGVGGTLAVSQAEVFINSNATHFMRESLQPGTFVARGNVSEWRAPEGVFACAGEDEWCALSVRDDQDWQRLLRAIGRADLLDDAGLATAAGRLARRAEVDAIVAAWTAGRTPREVTQLLQAAHVPAGFMQRLAEYHDDPHLMARHFIRMLEHPGLPGPLPTENAPVLSLHMSDPELRPAPYHGEHTRAIAVRLLGLTEPEIDVLIASGDLEDMQPDTA